MDRWMDGWMAFIRPLDLKISAEFFTYLHICVFFSPYLLEQNIEISSFTLLPEVYDTISKQCFQNTFIS